LSANAYGAWPMTFRWKLNANGLTRTTKSLLSLPAVRLTDAGLYTVTVRNKFGAATGIVANLIVLQGPPTVTAQPGNQHFYPGGTPAFTVTADGSMPLSYQWRFNNADLIGATNASLALPHATADRAGVYSVVISNVFGHISSSNATLTVDPIVVWGDDSYGQMDIPTNSTRGVAVAHGYLHSLSLQVDGTVTAWGRNNFGQTDVPPDLSNVVAVAAGDYHSLALKADGTVVAWGDNTSGQTNVPVDLSNVVAIAAGHAHSLALDVRGRVVGWGDNTFGQIQSPGNLTNAVAISAGFAHSLALRGNGSVAAWGMNSGGQTNVPPGFTNVVAIAAGWYHCLALNGDGTVIAWGDNGYGQLAVPSGLSNVTAIAAGSYHSMALRFDGTVAAWGDDTYDQSTVPTGLTNIVAIASGGFECLALTGTPNPAPQLSAPEVNGNQLTLTLPTARGRVYYLRYKNSLKDIHWTLLPPLPGDGTVRILTDPAATAPTRFYHVLQQ